MTLTKKLDCSEQGYRNLAVDETGRVVAASRWYPRLATANQQADNFIRKANASQVSA